MGFTARHPALGRLLAAILCVLTALTHAETAVQAWVRTYNGPGNDTDYATAVAVDGSNNVIVTGYSTGSGSDWDYLTIKYSSTGVPLWTNRYCSRLGPGNDVALDLALDGSNNVIVTGYSWPNGWDQYYATIKYSSAGVPLWTNGYYWGRANAVVVDGNNNVIVTGYSSGPSSYDYATIKYSSTGVPLWTNRYNGPGNSQDFAEAVAVDGSNNVIVTGYSWGNGSSWDYATIKYSTAGVPLWTNRYNGPGNGDDFAIAMAVDGSNNVVVTGYATNNLSGYDYATIKYSSAGEPLWTNCYNGPGNGSDCARAVAVDGSNNVIVTGYSTNSATGYDYATIKYSSDGVPLWTNRYNGPTSGNDYADAVAVDGSNDVIVTGFPATIKYSSTGATLWTKLDNITGADAAVDRSGNVIVTGVSPSNNYDFATIKYICVPEPVLTGLQPTNGTFQMRVDDVLQPGTLVVEAATNLTGWKAIFTNTTPSNVLFYTDPKASNYVRRFYRAFQFP